jgi:MFS transporter, DHA1 family, inner membrane transport protein
MVNLLKKPLHKHLPLIGLLSVQLLAGIILTPLNNFGGIYINETFGYSLRDVALVIALGQLIGMVTSILSGSLNDRWGYKWFLLLGASSLAFSSLMFIIQVPWLVILLWWLTSVGMGFSTVSGQGYLVVASSAGILGLASALFNWGYTLGGAVGTPLATMILGENNYIALGLFLSGLGVLVILIASLLPRLYSQDKAKPTELIQVGYGVLLRRHIAILSLLRFLPTCFYGILTLLPLLIKQQSGSNVTVAVYVTTSSIFASLTQLLAGRIADRYGARLPTQIAFGFILVSIVGMIFTAQTLWGLFIFGTLGIGAAWALSTLLPSLVVTAAEPEIRGRVFGILHFLWTIAMALGTLLGGSLLEINVQLPFMIVGILNIIALALTIPFFQMAKAKRDLTTVS